MPSGILTEVRDVHRRKAPSPISVTFSWIVTLSRAEHPSNISSPITVIDFGTTNEVILSNEEDESNIELEKNQRLVISRLMTKLNPRGKYIINAYFGLDGNKPKTLEEIGKEMGNLSKERIRQLKEKNLRILRSEIMMLDNMELLFK